MSDAKAAQQLIMRSRVDLTALEAIVDNPGVADEVFGFLAQQAVEKALKAHLAMMNIQFPVTHNLTRLVSMLEEAGTKVPESGLLFSLTPFAVQYRYEGLDFEDPLDRKAVLKSVRNLVTRVRAFVEEEPADPSVSEKRSVYRVGKNGKKKTTKGQHSVRRKPR